MDYFLALCQAFGVALAIGTLLGAFGAREGMALPLAVFAAALGAALAALSMSADDEPLAGAIVVGAVGGWLGTMVVSGIVAGATTRAEGGAAGLAAIVVLAALVLAGLSILLPPVSLLALAAVSWLAVARRRRAQRKYEGLRILR